MDRTEETKLLNIYAYAAELCDSIRGEIKDFTNLDCTREMLHVLEQVIQEYEELKKK